MTSRILPPAEWSRLAGTEAETIWPVVDRETTRVVVVEDEAGEIVGCHVLWQVWHLDGLWIAPAHRGKAGVARRLWATVQRTARALGARAVMTTAIDDRVRTLLGHVGAVPLPGEHYVVSMRAEKCQH